MRIATGEDADPVAAPQQQKMGKVGGKVRAATLSPEKRKAITEKAAKAR